VSQAHDEPIRAMQWSHSGQLLLSGDEGGVVKYWQSTLNNLKAFKAHKEPIRDLTFSPSDGHFATCSDDQTCSIWDLETQAEVACLKGHGWDVKACKWHPTKGLLLTGSKDQLIKLWDPRSSGGSAPRCLADLHAHKNTVNRLAWSPSNPYWFLSGSRDNLVKVYDIRTMKVRCPSPALRRSHRGTALLGQHFVARPLTVCPSITPSLICVCPTGFPNEPRSQERDHGAHVAPDHRATLRIGKLRRHDPQVVCGVSLSRARSPAASNG